MEIRRCTRCGTTGPHDIEWQVSSGQWLTLTVLIICGVVPGILYGIWLGFTGGNHGLWICTACGARRASVPPQTTAQFFPGCEIKPGKPL